MLAFRLSTRREDGLNWQYSVPAGGPCQAGLECALGCSSPCVDKVKVVELKTIYRASCGTFKLCIMHLMMTLSRKIRLYKTEYRYDLIS